MNCSIVVVDGFFQVQALPAILEDLLGGALPRGDAGLREQSAAQDQGRQRQDRHSLSQGDSQGDGRDVPRTGEEQEIGPHDRDPVQSARRDHDDADVRARLDGAIDQ